MIWVEFNYYCNYIIGRKSLIKRLCHRKKRLNSTTEHFLSAHNKCVCVYACVYAFYVCACVCVSVSVCACVCMYVKTLEYIMLSLLLQLQERLDDLQTRLQRERDSWKLQETLYNERLKVFQDIQEVFIAFLYQRIYHLVFLGIE